jgi:hypothetical protein
MKGMNFFSAAAMAVLLLVSGCKSEPPRKMNALEIGMSRRDVVLLMGSPYKVHTEGRREVLQYQLHKDINEPYAPDEPYWVFLEDGKVIQYGRNQDLKTSQPKSNEEVMPKIQVR